MSKNIFFAFVFFALAVTVLLVMFFFRKYGLWDELQNVNPEEAKRMFTKCTLFLVGILTLTCLVFTLLFLREKNFKKNQIET